MQHLSLDLQEVFNFDSLTNHLFLKKSTKENILCLVSS